MNKQSELKYIPQLSLRNLKRIYSGYMCSCPICDEGSSPWKTRLYILTEKKNYITVFCHNCGFDTNLKNFIKSTNPYIYEEYIKEEKQELLSDLKNGTLIKKQNYQNTFNTDISINYNFNLNQKYFKPAKNYKESVEFCKRRKIIDYIDNLYYNIHTNHMLSGMIVFPFYMKDRETLYGFQGRHTEKKLFHTHSKNENMKIYNIFDININKTIFVFESIIDSLMVPNSIAMLGTSLSQVITKSLKDVVYVCDNDTTGMKKTLQYLNDGKKCFIFPDSFNYKDFNESVVNGINKSTLPSLITENTYHGIAGIAKIKMNMMKRKK